MNWPPDPKSWFEYPAECLWYLMPGIVFHAAALILSFIAVAVLRFFSCHRPRVATMLIFQGYLLIAAMLVNGIWSCAIWGNLYWSVDYTADFSVFFPITSGQIEYSWGPEMSGGLNGISLAGLNMIWALFAATAWGIALIATRWTTRSGRITKGEQGIAHNPLPAPSRIFRDHYHIQPESKTRPRQRVCGH